VRAAKRAAHAGVPSVIAPGKEPGVLDRVLAGDDVGTMVYPQDPQQKRRKRWIGRDLRPRGTIRVDEGARDAILARGKSLLPSGVKDVAGTFAAGDPVEIALLDGAAFARGLAGYSADEIRKIRGVKTAEIEGVLGYRYLDEVVHRDDLVLI
jgi:glutamate 5-kinase